MVNQEDQFSLVRWKEYCGRRPSKGGCCCDVICFGNDLLKVGVVRQDQTGLDWSSRSVLSYHTELWTKYIPLNCRTIVSGTSPDTTWEPFFALSKQFSTPKTFLFSRSPKKWQVRGSNLRPLNLFLTKSLPLPTELLDGSARNKAHIGIEWLPNLTAYLSVPIPNLKPQIKSRVPSRPLTAPRCHLVGCPTIVRSPNLHSEGVFGGQEGRFGRGFP